MQADIEMRSPLQDDQVEWQEMNDDFSSSASGHDLPYARWHPRMGGRIKSCHDPDNNYVQYHLQKTRTAFQQPLGSSTVERAGVDGVQGSMNTAPQIVVVDTDTGDDVDGALALALTQTHHLDRSDTALLEASEA